MRKLYSAETSISFNIFRDLYIYILPGFFLICLVSITFLILNLSYYNEEKVILFFKDLIKNFITYLSNLKSLTTILFFFFLLTLFLSYIIGHIIFLISQMIYSLLQDFLLSLGIQPFYNYIYQIKKKKQLIDDIGKMCFLFSLKKCNNLDITFYEKLIKSIDNYLLIDEWNLLYSYVLHMKYLERYGNMLSFTKSIFTAILINLLIIMIIKSFAQVETNSIFNIYIFLQIILSIFLYTRILSLEQEFLERLLSTFIVINEKNKEKELKDKEIEIYNNNN